PTPLTPSVRELARLHRAGKTSEILQGLDELILALDSSSSTNNATSQTVGAICERLDNLESQLLGESPRNETPETKRLADLEQKIEGMTTRMAQFASAIIQIQNNLNNQPKRNKSYYNNSYYTGQTTRIQPLTEDNLAKRLGVNVETVRKERSSQPPPLFVGWSKRKDTSGIGWEFNEKTGLYHPVT
ncbi:MAG: hypothetical protein ACR2LR_06220, partial [Hassallia sp.]